MDNSVKARIVQVMIMRLVAAVVIIGGSIYLYHHPNALSQAGHGFAERYMPPMATLPELNPTPTPGFHR